MGAGVRPGSHLTEGPSQGAGRMSALYLGPSTLAILAGFFAAAAVPLALGAPSPSSWSAPSAAAAAGRFLPVDLGSAVPSSTARARATRSSFLPPTGLPAFVRAVFGGSAQAPAELGLPDLWP